MNMNEGTSSPETNRARQLIIKTRTSEYIKGSSQNLPLLLAEQFNQLLRQYSLVNDRITTEHISSLPIAVLNESEALKRMHLPELLSRRSDENQY
jgi:hypothetical protein